MKYITKSHQWHLNLEQPVERQLDCEAISSSKSVFSLHKCTFVLFHKERLPDTQIAWALIVFLLYVFSILHYKTVKTKRIKAQFGCDPVKCLSSFILIIPFKNMPLWGHYFLLIEVHLLLSFWSQLTLTSENRKRIADLFGVDTWCIVSIPWFSGKTVICCIPETAQHWMNVHGNWASNLYRFWKLHPVIQHQIQTKPCNISVAIVSVKIAAWLLMSLPGHFCCAPLRARSEH